MNTLKSAIDWFLAHCLNHRKLSPHTIKAYTQDLDLLEKSATEALNEAPVTLIDRNFVQRWLATMIGMLI